MFSPLTRMDLLARIRISLCIFSTSLIISGLTASFAREVLRMLSTLFMQGSPLSTLWPSMAAWLTLVRQAIEQTYTAYPFLAYGYDWLAFGHFIIAIPFVMALRDPLRHLWVINFGLAACISVIPFAFVFGAVRGIPFFWRVIDALFGMGGLAILLVLRRDLARLAQAGK